MSTTPVFAIDYVAFRTAIVKEMMRITLLDQNHIFTEEPETTNVPRGGTQGGDAAYAASLPYMTVKIINPSFKVGDDDKRNIPDAQGNPTNNWNSGGQRKVTVSFKSYGNSHEEAYNYMALWQAALDSEPTQENLRKSGIAVWLMQNLADISQLLNTGYEGRANMDVDFGVASNITEALGDMGSVEVTGTVGTDSGTVTTDQTVKFN